MNRQQKRKYKKDLKRDLKKASNISFIKQLGFKEQKATVNRTDLSIPEGSKVKFRIDKMKAHPDWNKLEENYRNFVETNVNTVFTVEYDEQYLYEPLWVCLAEDSNPIKWLFYIGDLQVIEEE